MYADTPVNLTKIVVVIGKRAILTNALPYTWKTVRVKIIVENNIVKAYPNNFVRLIK